MSLKSLKKLIVVDDDDDILQVTEFTLEALKDTEQRYCRNAQEGINEALLFSPDLMIVDVMMPGMDGIAMAKYMGEHPQLKNIPVVFFTAKIQKIEIAQYLEMGIQDVIIKPFDPLLLPQRILEIWDKIAEKGRG